MRTVPGPRAPGQALHSPLTAPGAGLGAGPEDRSPCCPPVPGLVYTVGVETETPVHTRAALGLHFPVYTEPATGPALGLGAQAETTKVFF